jgi:hypothetical protein
MALSSCPDRRRDRPAEHLTGRLRDGYDSATADHHAKADRPNPYSFAAICRSCHVAGRSGAVRESQVEREPALEQPTVGRGLDQASEKPIEGDAFAVSCEACAVSGGACTKTLLESLAERCSVAVPHAAGSERSRSMKRCTRAGRLEAAVRRRCDVVRPRSSAWRTASSICSG